MRTLLLYAGLIGLVWSGGGPLGRAAEAAKIVPPSDVLLRCHFAGLNQLLADPKAAKLKQIWALPSSADLKRQAFDQLARVPFLMLSNQLPKNSPSQTNLLRPLLEDVLSGESFLEWRGPVGQPGEFVFGLVLGEERARLWSANLQKALEEWKLGNVAATPGKQMGEGWVLKHRDGLSAFAFARVGGWVVIGWGPESLPSHAQLVQRIKAEGRPGPQLTGDWLAAEANLERLKPWLPPLGVYAHPPLAHLTMSNRAEYVRTSMTLEFPGGHGWKNEPWTVPTALIRDPLISFTAVQGIAPLLGAWKIFQKLGFSPQPNQVFFWANSSIPFLSHFAAPMSDAGKQLARVAPLLPSLLLSNGPVKIPGNIGWDTNFHAVVWKGLPIAPQLRAVKDRQSEYLVGSLFLPYVSTNPAPAELFKAIQGRTNLVYYDWETTGPRLQQWCPYYQLTDIATGRTFAGTNAPTQCWLMAIMPLLGNSVTEITASSPTQMTLVRNAHCGFTGFELVSFTRWLDSPEFPKLSVVGQPKPVRPAKPSQPKQR